LLVCVQDEKAKIARIPEKYKKSSAAHKALTLRVLL
jgi:hypothetical protein